MAYPPNQVPDAPKPASMLPGPYGLPFWLALRGKKNLGGAKMTEFQRNKIVEAIARTAINACAKYIQKALVERVVGAIVDKATKGGKDGSK